MNNLCLLEETSSIFQREILINGYGICGTNEMYCFIFYTNVETNLQELSVK